MNRFQYYLLALLIVAQLILVPYAWAADNASTQTHQQREAFAKNFAQSVVTILHNPAQSYKDRKNILRQAFADSVDTRWIAKFVLGRAWRDATDEQRDRYTSLYRRFLTETYVSNFAENPGNSIYTITISGVTDNEDNVFTVHTQMQLMNQTNVKVDYRVCDQEGAYKVQDIIIENVSLITTHRAEFGKLAAQQGVDGVIKSLEEKIHQGKTDMTLSMR